MLSGSEGKRETMREANKKFTTNFEENKKDLVVSYSRP